MGFELTPKGLRYLIKKNVFTWSLLKPLEGASTLCFSLKPAYSVLYIKIFMFIKTFRALVRIQKIKTQRQALVGLICKNNYQLQWISILKHY